MPATGEYVPDSLFSSADPVKMAELENIQETIDALADKYGKNIVAPGSTKLATGWEMKRDLLSPCCTTRIEDILTVS